MASTGTSTAGNTIVTQDDTSSLKFDGGGGISIAPGTIAAIVILLVLALAGLIIACAYAFGGFKRCCSCCGRSGRKKRLSQLPVYSDRGYLDERDKLPAWNPSASTTEIGLSRMASVKQGLFPSFTRKGTMDRPLMQESPVTSPRNSQLTRHSQGTLGAPFRSPTSPYMNGSNSSSQKSRFSMWQDERR
ncbi:hypothetical protein CB0940_00848 [Cercospora beticola]|uniref:Uncharacterized protein n=1 Tax=Cercospora beticola TaxID=122368 RepID=A0A2G5I9G8_CERBT|nr:hypothetical protein CB0940_00848 [Cercospora beticola]PIB01154.1 hypothetical protein CB0940_00848 [Cercospora beticola]WPA96275.1 hypothetical protein RHO25_000881 [Cercospora beticola]CAK1355429.1 unnamed protein product [Cercospora beticola]